MDENCHSEPAIEELLAESRCDRESKIRKQFYRGLRKNPFRNGLKRAPRFSGNLPHAPQVEPLKSSNRRGANNRGDKNSGSIMDRQTKLGGRETVRPGTPCHHRDGKPLKGNGRGIKDKPHHRADLGHGQQFFHAPSSTPRHNHAECQKNPPEVPVHPRIRTLSASAAQVSTVLLCCAQARTAAPRCNRR